MKRILIILLTILEAVLLCACENKNTQDDIEMEMINFAELQQESKTISSNYKNIDISDAKIIIPETKLRNVTFEVGGFSEEQLEERFVKNIETLGCEKNVKPSDIYVYTKAEENALVSLSQASDMEKNNRNACLLYSDGVYSQSLYKTSYMCEMCNNTIPKELTNDTSDYSQNMWGYRALDLGTEIVTYNMKNDDITGISYNLNGEDVYIEEMIQYVQAHVKDYYFCGSDILDYKVATVTVRQLTNTDYYYQMHVQAYYKGIPINNDEVIYQDEYADYITDDHIVSVFRKDKIDYIWASCNSYDNAIDTGEINQYVSLEYACEIVEAGLTAKKKFDIDSIQILYSAEFDRNENGEIVQVLCHPVYHFTVKNPKIAGYAALYFDVDVEDGTLRISYK